VTDIRRLGDADLDSAARLSRLAFGGDPQAAPPVVRAAMARWGAFDERGRLLAKANDREQGHWFGGRLVPSSGVAGVAVAPEARGRGLARDLLRTILRAARERGALISTLFRTAPALYRRMGWEQVGSLTWTTLPSAALAGLRPPPEMELHAAEPADVPAILHTYRRIAEQGNGLLERSGPLFDTSPDAVLAGHDGISVAVGPSGEVEGYASWSRGRGYDGDARLTVPDLLGLTGRATARLLGMLGSWSSVTPTLALRLPDPDPVWLLAPVAGAVVESAQPWMLRLVDAAGAVAARGWPAYLSGSVDLDISDPVCPWNAGRHRLVLDGGEGRLEPGGSGAVRLDVCGLAVLYAGSATPSLLRRAGLLQGGDPGTDSWLTGATAGPVPALLDHF
jgi:predicted acetyltransferase